MVIADGKPSSEFVSPFPWVSEVIPSWGERSKDTKSEPQPTLLPITAPHRLHPPCPAGSARTSWSLAPTQVPWLSSVWKLPVCWPDKVPHYCLRSFLSLGPTYLSRLLTYYWFIRNPNGDNLFHAALTTLDTHAFEPLLKPFLAPWNAVSFTSTSWSRPPHTHTELSTRGGAGSFP